MSGETVRETCGCGAEWEGTRYFGDEREKFREAHAACREPKDNQRLQELLSAIKVHRNATESRCRLLSSREATDSMLKPDRDLYIAAEQIEALLPESKEGS